MITGVRLTQLAIGEPLAGGSWEYKNLTGKAAASKRLEDIFYNAKYMGFNFVIDTIRPEIKNGQLTFEGIGINGDKWPFEERMAKYKELCLGLDIQLLLEVEFPTKPMEGTVYSYADFFLDFVSKHDWVKWWQIQACPNGKEIDEYLLNPIDYVNFMRYAYPRIKEYSSEIKLGGPGIFSGVVDYVQDRSGWLSIAMGEKYGTDSIYSKIGDKGFLPYIDFFGFQGRQDAQAMSYVKFPQVIDVLREAFFTRIGENNIRIFSTYQGRRSYDNQSMASQSYYELSEFMNCLKKGVIPFKNQMVDEYPEAEAYNGKFNADKLDYGLFKWHLGVNSEKPAVKDYLFLLKTLGDYSIVTVTSNVAEPNDAVDSLTLSKKDSSGETLITVIWPKTYNTETVVLYPQYNREYLLSSGEQRVLDTAKQIILENDHFLIVFERVQQLPIDIENLEKSIGRKLNYTEQTLADMISLLPDSYNKEITDLNYYKLLRALALEMGEAKVELDMLKEDQYIDTAKKEAIYNNFGVLVNLRKKAEWDWEKYRRLVKGVTQSLLEGPTHKSIVNALQLFTNFEVHVTEMFQAGDKFDKGMYTGINPQFAFVVEIEKPLEANETQEDVYSDAGYILNIVKPAHTLSLVIVTLSGRENWREEYKNKHGIPFDYIDSPIDYFDPKAPGKVQDPSKVPAPWRGILTYDSEQSIAEGTFGWKHIGYSGQVMTANTPMYGGGIVTNAAMTNGGMFIGPRYVLYDESWSNSALSNNDSRSKAIVDQLVGYLDVSEYEHYTKAKSSITAIETNLEEVKFGLDHANLIRLNGGPDRLRILNQFKLGYSTKIRDTYAFEPEYIFDDKYVFRNTLRTLRFNNTMGFGGRFAALPDQAIVFNFEMPEFTFRKKIIKLSDDTEIIVDRMQDNISEIEANLQQLYQVQSEVKAQCLVEYDIGYQEDDIMEDDTLIPWLRLNGPIFSEKKLGFRRHRAIYEMGTDYDEVIPAVTESCNVDPQWNPHEFLRPYSLSEEMYHVHKKVLSVLSAGQDYVLAAQGDLYPANTPDLDSLTRVYVNGVLMPSWAYEELISWFDKKRAYGIRFLENVVCPGDVVSLMYMNDRNVIVGNFPIDDEFTPHLEDLSQDSFIVFEKTAANVFELVIDALKDTYNGALDAIHSLIENSAYDQMIKKIIDVPEFEGAELRDYRDFSRAIAAENRMTLNKTLINQSLMVMIPRDIGVAELVPAENIEVPKNVECILTGTIVDWGYEEPKVVIQAAVEFEGPEHTENDIVASLEILDNPMEFGMQPFEQWINKEDTGAITDATTDMAETKYDVKEDRPYHDYVPSIYADLFDISQFTDKVIEHGAMVFDARTLEIIDTHVYDTAWLYLDKFMFFSADSDHSSHDVMFAPNNDTYRTWLIVDTKSEFGPEFSDSKTKAIVDIIPECIWNVSNKDDYATKSIGNIIDIAPSPYIDTQTLQSNIAAAFRFCGVSKFNRTKFLTKPVTDYEGWEMIPSDQLDKVKLIPKVAEYHNETFEAKYNPKNTQFNGDYQKPHSDTFVKGKIGDTPVKNQDSDHKERYSLKAAVVFMEMVRQYGNREPETLRTISMT